MSFRDTIYALSSGPGRAGIAVVRVSGNSAGAALDQLIRGPRFVPRKLTVASLRHPVRGDVLDRGMAVWLPGPATATGEDMAEFHLHGSPAVVASFLSALGELQGMRMAVAGEFTRRAFANGKMDLIEVEGVADLLVADTEAQRRLAMRQLTGEASRVYEQWRGDVLGCLSLIEAAIDFSEEDDEVERALLLVRPRIDSLTKQLRETLEKSALSGLLRLGTKVVIAGPPNAGKSSLLNWLAQREVALVSPQAGTTRDVVETRLVIDGAAVMISDTAGLRYTYSDPVEGLGIARARAEVSAADLLIWVTSPDTEQLLPERVPDIVVLNKIDLLKDRSIRLRNETDIAVSVRTGDGLEELRHRIGSIMRAQSEIAEDGIAVRERHKQSISESIRMLNDIQCTENMALEVMAEKMRSIAKCLASLTGQVDSEDVLGHIFSTFCIGK